MTSYAARGQVENGIVTLDVETVDVTTSNSLKMFERDSKAMYMSLEELETFVGETVEGDIIIVEHDGTEVWFAYEKDDIEKQKRIEFLKSMM